MEDEFDDDDFELDQTTKDRIEKNALDAKTEKRLKAKWRAEIAKNVEVQKYFQNFNNSTIDHFIDQYVWRKYQAFRNKDYYKKRVEEARTRWIDKANLHLQPILQKKLFDLQCLWRAEQIKLEGVELIADFSVWEHDIFNCPFVEILPEDIKLYKEFLNDTQFNRNSWSYEWQAYLQFKPNKNYLPEWYRFHNLKEGNSNLLLLPDIRGDKEGFYRKLYFDDKRSKDKTPRVPYDDRPILSFDTDKEYVEFASKFDNAKTQKKMESWVAYNRHSGYDSDASWLVMKMEEIGGFIPIESHHDYKTALRKSYDNFCFGKIVEHLPLAYEQYLFTKSMNLGFSPDSEYKFYKDLRKTYFDQIKSGRILNGEEGDLDF